MHYFKTYVFEKTKKPNNIYIRIQPSISDFGVSFYSEKRGGEDGSRSLIPFPLLLFGGSDLN